MVTLYPEALRRSPIEAEVTPFPNPDKTPPETIINFIYSFAKLKQERRVVKKKIDKIIKVRPEGIEPPSSVPKTDALSVELWTLEF